MSNEMIIKDDFEQGLNDLMRIQDVCSKLMATPHYKKIQADGIFAIVSYAKMINMNPLEALNGGLYYINGKVGMSSEKMCSYIRQAGHSLRKSEKSTLTHVILIGKRKDTGDEWVTEFSIDDAKKAGLIRAGTPWEKYPTDMCYNRAVSRMFRQMTPELSKGLGYTKEELESIKPQYDHGETIQIVKQTVTMEQAVALGEVLAQCSPSYREKIQQRMKDLKINGYDEFPIEIFEKIMPIALKSKEKYQASLMQQIEVEDVSQEQSFVETPSITEEFETNATVEE